MWTMKEPKRLRDDASTSDELRDDLGAYASAKGTYDVDRGLERHAALVAALGTAGTLAAVKAAAAKTAAVKVGTAAASAGATTTTAAGSAVAMTSTAALAVKVVAVIATVGIVTGATVVAARRDEPPAVTVAAREERTATPASSAVTHAPPTATPNATAAPSAAIEIARPNDRVNAPVMAPMTPAATTIGVEPAPTVAVVPTTTAAPVASTATEEIDNLVRARALAASEPARALELVDQGNQRFPRGLLYEEREALAIDCLLRLGRTRDAHARGDAFLRGHSESPLAEKVRAQISEH